MPADPHRTGGRRVGVAVALVVSAGYALGAAATTSFTWAANIMTGLPIAAAAALAIARWPARPVPSAVLVRGERPHHPYRAWVVLGAAVVGWELVEYLAGGNRGAHPTLSSMADALDAHYLAKAAAFFAWLWLGAAIVRAGTPVGARLHLRGASPP